MASVSEDGTCSLNFAVRSRHAASVSLCLVRSSDGQQQSKGGFLEIALDPVVNKTGKHVSSRLLQVDVMCA